MGGVILGEGGEVEGAVAQEQTEQGGAQEREVAGAAGVAAVFAVLAPDLSRRQWLALSTVQWPRMRASHWRGVRTVASREETKTRVSVVTVPVFLAVTVLWTASTVAAWGKPS